MSSEGPDCRLLLLGPPTLLVGDASWVLPFERRTQLLVLLGLAGGWVGRREAAAMLWPESDAAAASANLRKTLFRLAALPWGDRVQAEGGALRLDGRTDVAAFEVALRQGRPADALAIWQGEPLAGFDDDANALWTERLQQERERLRAAWRGASFAWLAGDVPAAAAVELSARLLAAEPWDEAALQLHMGWLQRSGQAAAAAQVHARFVDRVRSELGVAPGAALLALAPGAASAAAAGQPAPPVHMHTPAREAVDAGFVGRGAELRRIASLLEPDDGRLVTLLGPGGIGKTRLARRAAQELAAGFADGSAFATLGDLAAPDELAAWLARSLGLVTQGEAQPEGQLLRHLAGRRMLLVLDNFEHLVAAAGLVSRILEACAGVKVIVTSRVRLGLEGEQLLAIEGLPCPDPEDVDAIEGFDAVQLFVRAARRVSPGFTPAGEAAAIIEICARVGGWPLALEIVAAWTRVLSCADIAAELRRGIDLLREPDRARPGRHASIEAVFEQSWRLLGEAERSALARLSLFRGGFTAEAARALAGAAPPVLGALADQSLLMRDGARMHLHPLVQQFAGARLAGSEAAAGAARSHAQHFLGLLARLRPAAHDGERDALRRIEAEFENCRAAWQWAVGASESNGLARAASALCDFCDHRGRVAEGLAMFEEALASPPLAAAPGARAALLALAAHLLYRLDRYADARQAAEQALALAETHADDETQLQALNALGSCAMQEGRLADAAAHYGEHLRRAPAASDPHRAARTMVNLAIVEKAAGRFERALALYSQALVLAQRFGDLSSQVKCLHNLALLHLSRGELDAAGARLTAALALCERHGFTSTRATVLGALVDHARLSGDFESAHRHAVAAMAAAKANGQRGLVCGLTLDFVHIALHRAEHAAARRALAEAAAQALELGRPSTQLSVASWFAELLAATGEREAAVRVSDLVLAHPAACVTERASLEARKAAWAQGQAGGGSGPTNAISDRGSQATSALGELLRRLAAEADIGHAALLGELRSQACRAV